MNCIAMRELVVIYEKSIICGSIDLLVSYRGVEMKMNDLSDLIQLMIWQLTVDLWLLSSGIYSYVDTEICLA